MTANDSNDSASTSPESEELMRELEAKIYQKFLRLVEHDAVPLSFKVALSNVFEGVKK